MPRYIDADTLYQKIDRWRETIAIRYGKKDEYVKCLGQVLKDIDDAPTEDVVEVVRCKDCAYYNTDRYFECTLHTASVKPFDFCGFGERIKKKMRKDEFTKLERHFKNSIEDAPTANVIEVVRCKECKWFDGCGTCMNIGIAMLEPDWFCADGERKE